MKFMPALLPPEFRAMLREAENELDNVDMPLLDEQHLEHLNQVICESMEYAMSVRIVYHENKRNNLAVGTIHYVDPIKKAIRIVDKYHEWFELKLENIIDISLHDE
ncbi:YolD-like family protein [Cytobacillus pseudoceanisediminis]